MTVAKARREIGPLEFVRWQIKIIMDEADERKREWSEEKRYDYGFARVCEQIYYLHRRVDGLMERSKMPSDLTADDFRVKFEMSDTKKEPAIPDKPRDRPEGSTDEEYKAFRSRRVRLYLASLTGDNRVLEG